MATNFKMEPCEKDFYIVLFVSRNKDNKHIEGFKERRRVFITDEKHLENTLSYFETFMNNGIFGELCRCYVSVNKRSSDKVNRKILHWLLDNQDFPTPLLANKIAAIANEKECAAEHKWLIDFDSTDSVKLKDLIEGLRNDFSTEEISVHHTPHGYAIVLPHGFDSRWMEADERIKDIATIKRDDMLIQMWGKTCN